MKVSLHTAQAFLRPLLGGPASHHSISQISDFKIFREFGIVWIGICFNFDMSNDFGISCLFELDILVVLVFLAAG